MPHAMSSPSHTPSEIQSHLYMSLLNGRTADVQLRINGVWKALYHLHRVVLIQAGFFHSLFTGGFLESNRCASGGEPDEVVIRFDDPNITRAAFEICVAKLYGGGPELFLCPSLIPTAATPLTPSFQFPFRESCQTPSHSHPATPRFLLSLLATSIYLSIPSLTSQALAMVLNSIGPRTVHRYLSFAIGQGIGLLEEDEPPAAVGLEHLGKQIDTEDADSIIKSLNDQVDSEESDVACKLGSLDFVSDHSKADGPSVDSQLNAPNFNYGRIGDKVGEACACWLARWGADMLPYEEAAVQSRLTSEANLHPGSKLRGFIPPASDTEHSAPVLWRRGGLTAPWVRAVISSDDFFIKDERERYDFARRVVELRRRESLDETEEKEWQLLFQQGIYYSHILFEDLVRILQDISPTTAKPYVSVEKIHSSHWTQSLLRHHIVTRPSVIGSSSPPPSPENGLGITISTAEILSIISSEHVSDGEKTRRYYPVPLADTSQRIGDPDSAFASASMSADQLLASGQGKSGPGHTPTDQAHFFGILRKQHTAASCVQVDTTGKARWSPHPPMRFAIEFWGVEGLLEKSRLHSRTVWYAGSLFNVYVQVMRKKGLQLGIYLHRQSSVDPLPRISAPPIVSRDDRTPNEIPRPRPQGPTQGHVRSSSSTTTLPVAVPGSPSLPPSLMPTPQSSTNPVAPTQSYRDPRSVVSAHFTISCASATGSSLTRFSSKPDQFAINQSWGWKSSSLQMEGYIGGSGEVTKEISKEISLRATVVLGVI